MVTQYIATWTILELFFEAMAWPGERVAKRWWKQEGIDLAEARAAAEEGSTSDVDYDATEGPEYMQRV